MVVRKMQNAKSLGLGVLIILLLPVLNLRVQRADTRVQSVQPIQPVQPVPVASPSTPSTAPVSAPTPSTYLLGPDDQITIQGPEMDEVTNRPYRVDPEGYVSMPMLGRVKAGGLTIGDFDTQLNLAAAKYVRHPQLVASVAEFHSQPI